MIERLVTASVSRIEGSVIERLLALREEVRRFNEANGLRTALLYSAGWFVQWHEGQTAAIDKMLAVSRRHPDHSHLRVIHRSRGPAALSETLQIATLHAQDKPTDLARRLYELERDGAAQPAAAPLDIWRRLAAPVSGRHALAPVPPGSQRVVAVTSEFTESVELLRSAAERCNLPLAYQRFAGGDPRFGDVGAAYVDLGCAGRTRVHALSRGGLAHSVARLTLARLDAVVLLAADRPKPAEHQAAAVARFLAPLAEAPPLHIVGPHPESCALLAQLLEPHAPGRIVQTIGGVPGASRLDAVLAVVQAVHLQQITHPP